LKTIVLQKASPKYMKMLMYNAKRKK